VIEKNGIILHFGSRHRERSAGVTEFIGMGAQNIGHILVLKI